MKRLTLYFILTLILSSCKQEAPLTGQIIIDKAITTAGGDKFDKFNVDFDFRGTHFKASRNYGKFQLERHLKNSDNVIKDIVSNDGFKRLVNGGEIVVPDSMVPRYTASVNSVHYFSVLPYGLNDAAVNKEYIEDVTIKGKAYHKVKVTFDQEGGGEDYEDVFSYWINTETLKADYIAYSYNEDDGKGLRFREAYNERIVEGIRFVDYNNYKPNDESISVLSLDKLFDQGEMKLLSKIELDNISVQF